MTHKTNNMKQFRICKSTYITNYGNPFNEYYYLQQRKSFLGIKYWSTVTHRVGSISGDWKEVTQFKTYEEAYNFYMKIDKGVKPDSFKDEVISYI